MIINPTNSGGSNEAYALDSSTSRSATINPTLSMIIDDDTTMNPTYVTPGEVAYRSHIVKVSASDVMNYTLQITAASDGTTTLKNGETSIPGTTATIGKNLAEDTWGWSWSEVSSDNSEQTYYALPAYGSTGATKETGLLESNQANAENEVEFTRKLTFAANMSTDSPSGHYTTTAMLSLAATPKQLVFDGISTMQEMTSTICANATVNDTTRLRDTRDGNYYWVAKLADNNCWMTQNLALNLTDITLTPQDSDVQEDWTPNITSELWNGATGEENQFGYPTPTEEDMKKIRYYNPGRIIWAEPKIPDNFTSCGAISNLAECRLNTFKNVRDMISSNTLTNIIYDETTNIYDAHYLVGNYYNANAATANTALSTMVGVDAPASICPTTWRLPSRTMITSLVKVYRDRNESYDFYITEPIYAIFSGQIVDGVIAQAGFLTSYWGSTKGNQSDIDITSTLDADSNYKLAGANTLLGNNSQQNIYGLSIRCVAK